MAPTRDQSIFDVATRKATENVTEQGLENAHKHDITLMGFRVLMGEIRELAKEIHSLVETLSSGNGSFRRTKLDKAKQTGTPLVAGGGLGVILIEVLRVLS